MAPLLIGFGALAAAGLVALIFVANKRYVQGRRQAWSELAERTRLTFSPAGCFGLYGWASVRGLYRGRELRLYASNDSLTESLVEDTKIWVGVNHTSDSGFSLYPPMLPLAARLVPPRGRVLLGDAAFDQAFLLRGRPEAFVAAVFAPPELRTRLLRLRPGTGLWLAGQRIWLQRHGLEQDVEYLTFLFDLLCDLAGRVEQVDADSSPLQAKRDDV